MYLSLSLVHKVEIESRVFCLNLIFVDSCFNNGLKFYVFQKLVSSHSVPLNKIFKVLKVIIVEKRVKACDT